MEKTLTVLDMAIQKQVVRHATWDLRQPEVPFNVHQQRVSLGLTAEEDK